MISWIHCETSHPVPQMDICHIHSICQICVYIFGGFARCSTGNQSKSGQKNKKNKEKRTFKNKVITFARTSNQCNMWHVHSQAGKMADFLQCLFEGTSFIELNYLMHSLQDLATCPPEEMPINSVCQIYVYIFRCFTMCSTNQSKSGKKKMDVLK